VTTSPDDGGDESKKRSRKSASCFANPAVAATFDAYPKPLKAKLLALRRLILDTANASKGVGALQETPKWGQPSYLTPETKSSSTIHCVALALTYHLNKRKPAR
jgi:hypothetical protein